jgi:hypothetical protein
MGGNTGRKNLNLAGQGENVLANFVLDLEKVFE